MPNFIDYLLKPWKLLTLLGITGGGKPATSGSQPTGICFSQDLGDQVVHTCRIVGYEMPAFIFWASFLILTLFIIASVRMLRECLQIEKALRMLSTSLESTDPKDLRRIREVLASHSLTQPSWTQFEETLLIDGKVAYTTAPIDESFSRESLIENHIHGSLYSAIPGILTGVGLLMTFVAILDGLSHVSVAKNMDVTGIGGLINGLSGKFVSSIVAVGCAVLFTFVERFAYYRPQAAYRRLLALLTARFKRRTMEQLFYALHEDLLQKSRVRSSSTEATVQHE